MRRNEDFHVFELAGDFGAAAYTLEIAVQLGVGAARLTGQVLAVDGGFTTVRPLVK
jgi:hypothetical protein